MSPAVLPGVPGPCLPCLYYPSLHRPGTPHCCTSDTGYAGPAAARGEDSLGSEASLGLGGRTKQARAAQGGHRSSREESGKPGGVKGGIGQRLEGLRVSWAIYALETDCGRRNPEDRGITTRARRRPEYHRFTHFCDFACHPDAQPLRITLCARTAPPAGDE